jgi:hypothetical protein
MQFLYKCRWVLPAVYAIVLYGLPSSSAVVLAIFVLSEWAEHSAAVAHVHGSVRREFDFIVVWDVAGRAIAALGLQGVVVALQSAACEW